MMMCNKMHIIYKSKFREAKNKKENIFFYLMICNFECVKWVSYGIFEKKKKKT